MMVQVYQESDMAFFAKGNLIAAVGALAFCLLTSVAQAASCGNSAAGFEQWKVAFAETAKAAGVNGKGLQALAGAQYASGTIQADRSLNKAFSGSVDDFMRRRGGSAIISRGRSLKTVSAIVTLAYDCRRPQFFAPHAIAALKLVDSGALSASSVGAMHGEIGHTGFLPGNVLKYGVGSRNMRDKSTALMSTANFLRAHGWRAGAGYQGNIGAIAGWNSASVYQQAIARIGEAIDGG
jgi:membrane-bound lytic murein transglycosylase B